MSKPIIEIKGISKKYALTHQGGRSQYTALRDKLSPGYLFKKLAGKLPKESAEKEEFWALKDVSFDVQQGESIGIIGRNGAGKSTLLKILSKIVSPTDGEIVLRGRVASLLEVGTGFHPELTGRENIYLNGAILGMRRKEIERKFDEIVDFSGVEKFLDTPVKRYSSGMYVRLAFAVAAHLEPEILIVDEVLAVGDAEFQKKCFGKMQDVAGNQGRTIIFVSHDLHAVQKICTGSILLDTGKKIMQGETEKVVEAYINKHREDIAGKLARPVQINSIVTLTDFQVSPNPFESGQSINFSLKFITTRHTSISEIAILLYTRSGFRVAVADLRRGERYDLSFENPLQINGILNGLNLVEGEYIAGIYIVTPEYVGNFLELIRLKVSPQLGKFASEKTSHVLPYEARFRGIVEPQVVFF